MVDFTEHASLLIADDDRDFRAVVMELLTPEFETIGVDSGEEAIEVVESRSVDLAILDMHMAVMTGLDTLRWLKQYCASLPCILMTSDVSEELKIAAFQLDVFQVLRKPPRRGDLIETVHRALKL